MKITLNHDQYVALFKSGDLGVVNLPESKTIVDATREIGIRFRFNDAVDHQKIDFVMKEDEKGNPLGYEAEIPLSDSKWAMTLLGKLETKGLIPLGDKEK